MIGRRAGRAILSLAVALSFSAPALAQLAPSEAAQVGLKDVPPPPSDIVVTAGPPPKISAVTKQAEAITPDRDKTGEPLPQFQEPVCPGIAGLPRELAEQIVDRVRYDAERAGIATTHGEKCSPNVLIVITRNGQAEVKALMRNRGYLFSDLSSVELRELENDRGPVHAWTNIVRRGRDGQNYSGAMDMGGQKVPVLSEWAAHSKIYLKTRLEIRSSVVLIDVAAIDSLTINQIADYAAMRTLVYTKPFKGQGATQSILTLFDPDARSPLELSAFDLAYLRETYASDPNMPAYGKLVDAARDVRKAAALAKSQPATPAPDIKP